MLEKRFWEAFVESYVAKEGFWHVPKKSVSAETEEIWRQTLGLLKRFKDKIWRNNQRRFQKRLVEKNLSTSKSAALARVQKAVFDYLGFAWVDGSGYLRLTEMGERFLAGQRLETILRRQLVRFHFWNPGTDSKFKEFHLIPHIFLLQVLLRFSKTGITRDEYLLFVCRATSHEDLPVVTNYIKRYRKLGPHQREELRKNVEERTAKKGKSPYRAAALDYNYAISFYCMPSYLITDGRIKIAPGEFGRIKNLVNEFEEKRVYVHFRNEEDWFGFYGTRKPRNSMEFAFRYYRNAGDLGSLAELLEHPGLTPRLKRSGIEPAIREALLESYLEYQPEKLEHGMKKVGRQYPTAVGPIDLLAKDKEGAYVVVELKKGRTSDRVFGQILRYMAWVRENLRNKRPVRGLIVAEKVDRGLQYGMKIAKNSRIGLKRYELKVNFWDAG